MNKTLLYRGLIIPVNEEDDYAAVYDNADGKLTASSSEHPIVWFDKSQYHIPSTQKYAVDVSAELYLTEKKNLSKMLLEWCKPLSASMHYHSRKCAEIRNSFASYPVKSFPDNPESGKCYFEDHDDYLAFRMFQTGEDEVFEFKRWILSPKTGYSALLVQKYGEWEKESCGSCYGFSDADILSVKDQLLKTDIGKRGLFEYMEYNCAEGEGSTYGCNYLTSLFDAPIIETLAKIGMCNLIPEVLMDKIRISYGEKHLWQKLGLSKANFEFARREHLSAEEFEKLISINRYDETVDSDAFFRWNNEYEKADIYSIGVIVDHIAVNLKQIIDYLESVYYEQGCECEEAIIQWRDYSRSYESFYKHNPKTDEEKFPDSLKKAHDVLAMQNSEWAYDTSACVRKFAERMADWKQLEFEDDHYRIMLPQTPRDISQEGTRQHHCVASYIKNVLNGDCLILFLRRKGQENRSFLTLEYDLNKSVRQMRGKFNRSIDQMVDAKEKLELMRFLAQWTKKTGIDTGITAGAA